MIRGTLDELLDHSAPPTRPAAKHDLDAMIADAREPTMRTLRPRVLIAGGLATIFAFGGVGFAAATDGFSWAPWAQDPIGAVQFTMGNGFQCELRFSEYTKGRDPAYVSEVNGILEDWYQSTDVLPVIQAIVPSRLERLRTEELEIGISEGPEPLLPEEVERREWARQWLAWRLAVSDAEWQQLETHGIRPGDERFTESERDGQIQCLDENNEPYGLRAGL
jgi:hypothetical protein